MDEQESSSGLMIGVLIGGGVLVLLVVLALFGGGFFFWADRAPMPVAVGPKPPPPMQADQTDERKAIKKLYEDTKEVTAAQQRVIAGKRLIGIWDAKTTDGDRNTLDFRADGALEMTMESRGKTRTVAGTWEVPAATNGDGLKLRRLVKDGPASDQDIRFLDEDRFILEGPGGGATYIRRANQAK